MIRLLAESVPMRNMFLAMVPWLIIAAISVGVLIARRRWSGHQWVTHRQWIWILPGAVLFGLAMGMREQVDSTFYRATLAGAAAAVLAFCCIRARQASSQ